MRESKWNFYVDGMQKHHSVCCSTCTVDSMKFITELIDPVKYNKILDIGVGEGKETSILKELGYTPTGVITGEDNIRWAADNYKDIKFISCDMHDLPFGSNTFDSIYTNQVFEHAYAPFIFLLECYCVLRIGGLFYVRTPKYQDRYFKNDPSSIEAQYLSHHHPSMFSAGVYRQIFEKTGFNILKENDEEMSFLLEKGPITNLHPDLRVLLSGRDKI